MMTFGSQRPKIDLEASPFNYRSDNVEEILKALPAKSLLRFRSVCKHWRSLIDDPYFVNLHRAGSYRRCGGVKSLVGYKERKTSELLFKLVDLNGNASSRTQSLPKEANSFKTSAQGVEGLLFDGYAVWNPTTRKRLHLPPSPGKVRVLNGFLGFDSRTGDYKVLQIWSESIQILTVGTNSWRKIDPNLVPTELLIAARSILMYGVYAQNKIFFRAEKAGSLTGILAFLVGEERFQFLQPPEGIDTSKNWFTIEFGNTIALIRDINQYGFEFEFEVWILNDFGSQKWDQIKYGNRPMVFYGHSRSRSQVICSMDNRDEVLVRTAGCKSYYWDVRKKTTRNGPNLVWNLSADIYTKHVETLFDPTLSNEARQSRRDLEKREKLLEDCRDELARANETVARLSRSEAEWRSKVKKLEAERDWVFTRGLPLFHSEMVKSGKASRRFVDAVAEAFSATENVTEPTQLRRALGDVLVRYRDCSFGDLFTLLHPDTSAEELETWKSDGDGNH